MLLKIRRLKKQIEEAKEEAEEAVVRAEKEKKLQTHLAARLRRVEVELDILSRGHNPT